VLSYLLFLDIYGYPLKGNHYVGKLKPRMIVNIRIEELKRLAVTNKKNLLRYVLCVFHNENAHSPACTGAKDQFTLPISQCKIALATEDVKTMRCKAAMYNLTCKCILRDSLQIKLCRKLQTV